MSIKYKTTKKRIQLRREMKEESLSSNQQEIFDWCKREYADMFKKDLLALIIDRVMQNERKAVLRIQERIDNAQEDCGNLDWISKDQALKIIREEVGKELGGAE